MKTKDRLPSSETRETRTDAESSEGRKRLAVERYIRMSRVLEQPGADPNTVKEIEAALQDKSPEEKALRIYESIVTYGWQRRTIKAITDPKRSAVIATEHPEQKKLDQEQTAIDPYFASEFKLLWNDEGAHRIFLERYGETRADLAAYRLSELGGQLRGIENSLSGARNEYAELKQDLNLQRVKNPTAVRAVKAKLEYSGRRIEELADAEQKITNLEGYEHTKENTDVAALVMYETLKRYHREAEVGFAWLPSRRRIHEKINETIEHTGKAPLLIGPPGTGKTTQIDAVAKERTGAHAIRIPCHPGLSEEGLVFIRDIKGGEGSYDYKGTVTEAATGYEHSLAAKPATSYGRVASLDEISQLSIDRALGPIKDIRQAKTGKPFSRFAPQEVLPGFQLAATSNVPIQDERLDREFARIPTNYFEMTPENPELYEFMLAKLLRNEGNLPLVSKQDLAPNYQKRELPEDKRETLKDGGIVVAMDELVENPADARHGFLYRFANAIRAIQDSYIHGSKFNEKHLANSAVYEDYNAEGKIVIKGYIRDVKTADPMHAPGGQMLKLKFGSSTITAEMVSRWTESFAQSGKADLPSWFRRMLQEHIDQTSPEDAERIRAIADYFHIFDEVRERVTAKPLVPKEIGYLSPRVPRPLHVERRHQEEAPTERESPKEATRYEAKQVLLDNGERVLVDIKDFASDEVTATLGERFIVDEAEFSFGGVVAEDENNSRTAQPIKKFTFLVGKFIGVDLYKVFSPQQVDLGILMKFQKSLNDNLLADLRKEVGEFSEESGTQSPQPKKRGLFGRKRP